MKKIEGWVIRLVFSSPNNVEIQGLIHELDTLLVKEPSIDMAM